MERWKLSREEVRALPVREVEDMLLYMRAERHAQRQIDWHKKRH
jgi:hypothetical protein